MNEYGYEIRFKASNSIEANEAYKIIEQFEKTLKKTLSNIRKLKNLNSHSDRNAAE